ncbi:MAG: hypothetical protein HOL01_00820 [Planctomycetaceae bacterium]|jgi:hypothetical protein|nr:hypothetical protein [Planctomycetaceae bacterium]MBT6487353.1 hypothetical protein [Planctomycetaceae bacterium]MBT6493067.1 hypothetical protein [Planctomycetaceae bacterium]
MISIECDECAKTYKVKPEMAGKRAKCKCGASIQIPAGPKKKKRLVSTPPKRKKPKAKPEADPWDEDTFADDDFGDDYGDDYDDDFDEPPRRSRNSPKTGGRSKKKGKKKRKGGGTSAPMKIAGLVFLGVAVLGLLLGLLVPAVGAITAGGIIIVCAALSFAGSLRCMIAAFQEDIMCGVMWFFVPFYSLYYIVTRFSELQEYILMWFGGVIGILICVGYFQVLQAI